MVKMFANYGAVLVIASVVGAFVFRSGDIADYAINLLKSGQFLYMIRDFMLSFS